LERDKKSISERTVYVCHFYYHTADFPKLQMHTIPHDLKEKLYMGGAQSSNIWKGISRSQKLNFI